MLNGLSRIYLMKLQILFGVSHSALDSCVFLLFPAWSSIHFLSCVLLSFSICLSLTSPHIVLPLHIAVELSPEIFRAQLVVA